MMENVLTRKFSQLSTDQKVKLREELRPQIERNIALLGRFLSVLGTQGLSEELVKAYHELETLEESEMVHYTQIYNHFGKDPHKELERSIEDGTYRPNTFKAMLEEVVDICGLLEKPCKKVKTNL